MTGLDEQCRQIATALRDYADLEALLQEPPPTGDFDLNPSLPPTDAALRLAGVLVPLVRRAEGLTVLLTQRTEHLAHHAGQISFPGGRAEPEDTDIVDTALRETEEEIGLDRRQIQIAGYLDAYRTGTGFHIAPVVGFVEPPFSLRLDRFEVAEAFEVPLAFILDARNHQRHAREWQGHLRHYYAMAYGDYYIWGATAGMLMNFYRRVSGQWPPASPTPPTSPASA